MSLQNQLFAFTGRMRRRDYWLLAIVSAIVFAIITYVINVATGKQPAEVFGLGDMITLIPNLWISIALMIKRTHDRDKSGWWILVYMIPIIGWIWSVIELGFLDGTPGPNRFGPSPKGLGESVEVFD